MTNDIDMMKGFFTVHRTLPREGPGEAADVHWALSQIPTPARVLDAACGSGADTETLAKALPGAHIEAIEKTPHFATETAERLADFGARITVREGDAFAPGGRYDFIWCAGAVYFAGIENALTGWRANLAPGGTIAFSEPVQEADASAAARAFWDGEYSPDTLAGLQEKVARAGYRILSTRQITGASWAAFYDPMEARIAQLRAQGATADVEAACAACTEEIAKWRAAPDEIAYLLMLVAPDDR